MNLSEVKIVADSSADLPKINNVSFSSVPLKIVTSEKEYVDDENLNVAEMVNDLAAYNDKSSTACPAPEDWLNAFDDSKYVFCVSITSNLSGTYNTACIAKQTYEEKHPDRKVYVIDTLSTGPEMQLIIDKLCNCLNEGYSFENTCDIICNYMKKTGLLFMLESMKNLANNGRVKPIVAKAAGLLGIRVVGQASSIGTLEVLEKNRGEKKALLSIINNMKKSGYKSGKVKISHCFNENAALSLKEQIKSEFQDAKIEIYKTRGLCSFYAEKGGLLVGFEK